MKYITERTEIAKALNYGKYPVLTINMEDHQGFDDTDYAVGCDIRCQYETSRYGTMTTKGHLYYEYGKFGISAGASMLKASFGASDVLEMAHWANTPIVQANQEVVVVMEYPSQHSVAVRLMKTSARVDPNCMTALTLLDIE